MNIFALDSDIFDAYNVKVSNVKAIRNAYILYTNKGIKCLKKLRSKTDDFDFTYNVINFLKKKGFNYVENINSTKDGELYISTKDGVYVMSDIIEGRECDFKNLVELKKAVELLACLHLYSKGFTIASDNVRNKIGKWLSIFKNDLDNINKIRDFIKCKKNKSSIDENFIQNVDYYIKEIKDTMKLIDESPYTEICKEFSTSGGICHNDFIARNFIIDNSSQIHFIDFDYCIVDLRIWDITNMIFRELKDNDGDIETTFFAINQYMQIYPLSANEIIVLKAIVNYPFDFIKFVNGYYIDRKMWTEEEFQRDIIRKLSGEEIRRSFIKEFKSNYI